MSESLESRLGQLRPREVSRSLEDGIARELDCEPVPGPARHDRFFWSAVASGAIAACVIIGVLATEPARRPNATPAIDRSTPGPLTALARADRRWGDELKLASDWSQP